MEFLLNLGVVKVRQIGPWDSKLFVYVLTEQWKIRVFGDVATQSVQCDVCNKNVHTSERQHEASDSALDEYFDRLDFEDGSR
jgi:hypothetical protein